MQNTTNTIAPTCKSCGKPLRGRADKKYCDDYCRATGNNKQNAEKNNTVRNINNLLLKNRRILAMLLPATESTTKIHYDKLHEKGFAFKYFTNTHLTKNGNTYHYVYDYGFRLLENNWYLIVHNNEK
jgi:hypothetical protein